MSNELFTENELRDALEFFTGRGGNRGLYIPPYQRPFGWGESDLDAFLEGLGENMKQMIKSTGEGFYFIGTVICFHDVAYKSVDPQQKNELPDEVWHVIDGQQRLTVLLITMIILHDYLNTRLPGISSNAWLTNHMKVIIKKLSFRFEIPVVDPEHRPYPRIIRAFTDQWSVTRSNSCYKNPISHYISEYGDHIRTGQGKFNHKSTDKGFQKAVKYMVEAVNESCEQAESDKKIPKLEGFFTRDGESALKTLLHIQELSGNTFDRTDKKECNVMGAIIFAHYLLERVKFMTLVTPNEESAFDIFESLNSTGIPLTSYETFAPKIVKFETFDGFKKSESKKHTDAIERYLNNQKPQSRSKATSEMVIAFALAESGEPLTKTIRDQRKYLINKYDACNDDDKRLLTKHLMHVSETCERLWFGNGDGSELFALLEGEEPLSSDSPLRLDSSLQQNFSHARFCLSFLKDAKHIAPIALIARFYAAVKNSPPESAQRVQEAHNLCNAIKTVAAFFAVWRSSRPDTDGIDAYYRQILDTGLLKDDGTYFGKFCRNEGIHPCIKEMRASFRYLLEKKGGNSGITIVTCDDWVKRSREIPIYKAKAVAKFIELLASNNTEPDDNPGYLKGVSPGVYPSLIEGGIWGKDIYESAEHLIPKSSPHLADINEKNRIGNLTLLPKGVNSTLGNEEWEKKRLMLALVSARNKEGIKTAELALLKYGVSQSTVENLKRTCCYLPVTEAIARREEFDNIDHVDERSKHLMERAWLPLTQWLDFDRPL